MREFFDLFNHRLISLFYRAWEKYRLFATYDRATRGGETARTDPITDTLYCFLGLGPSSIRGRLELEDETLLYYSGHMTNSRPVAKSLEHLLREYFQIECTVHQFQGRRLSISLDDQSTLGVAGTGRLPYNRLGSSAILGRSVWDVQSKFRVRLGPLDDRQFCEFLPSGEAFIRFCQLVRLYVGVEFDFDVQLVLAASCVPRCRIGGGDSQKRYLGWNTWLCSRPPERDADQAIFSGEGAPLRKNTKSPISN
jgi:type VI secretion system protein ImpH